MPIFDLIPEHGDVIEVVSDYTATDDATPLSIDSSAASTGDLTVSIDGHARPAAWKRLRGLKVQVQVAGRPARSLGKVSHVSGGDGPVSLVLDTVLNRLAVTRAAKPKTGTLASIFTYWASLCGVAAADVQVDSRVASIQFAAVGFYDSVWTRMKQLCAAVGVEVVSTDNTIVVRPPRPVTLVIDDELLVSTSWDVDDSTLAQQIEVIYYDPQPVVAGDQTADYSRSTKPSPDADDPFELDHTGGRAINTLPPGWVGYRSVPS